MNPSMFFKAPKFWTFWRFLLVKLHCSASLLSLAIFSKKNHKPFEKTICFLIKKPQFVTFREILLIQLHSTANLLPLAVFKNSKFFFEKPIFFKREAKFRTFWDILLIQFLLPLAIFEEKHNFFSKNTFLFFIKTNFWTFGEILLFQWPCSATMLLLAILKKSRIFPNNQSCFRNLFFCNVLRIITNSVAFYSEFATFITFLKNRVFSEKPIHFLKKTPIFRKFWDFVLFQWPCSVLLLFLAILKKSRIFSKTQSIFCQKKTNSWTLWRILQNWLLSASNWLLSAICKTTQKFFSKNQSFSLRKKPLYQRFQRSY